MLNAYDAGRLLPTRTMVLGRRKNIPAPSMQRHTMRAVLVIKCKSKNLNGNTNDTETILYRATTRF